MSDSLLKAKIITRNGIAYYAEGKHAGKRVGSVRQKSTNKQPENTKSLDEKFDDFISNMSNDEKFELHRELYEGQTLEEGQEYYEPQMGYLDQDIKDFAVEYGLKRWLDEETNRAGGQD